MRWVIQTPTDRHFTLISIVLVRVSKSSSRYMLLVSGLSFVRGTFPFELEEY